MSEPHCSQVPPDGALTGTSSPGYSHPKCIIQIQSQENIVQTQIVGHSTRLVAYSLQSLKFIKDKERRRTVWMEDN